MQIKVECNQAFEKWRIVNLPLRSGRLSLARRFNAGLAINQPSRHVVTLELAEGFIRRYATRGSHRHYPALKRRAKFTSPLRGERRQLLYKTGTSGKRSAKRTAKRRVDAKKYGRLLSQHLPAIIETEKENRRVLAIVDDLMSKGKDRAPEEDSLLKLLSHLIQEFEQRFYQPTIATPQEVLKELMNANGLKQSDLVPIFGSKGVTSEVINGKRSISKAQAKALAERFNTSTDVFL